jgi:pSer/pThr/pTyr-binding forkhead associated (FHA) protein
MLPLVIHIERPQAGASRTPNAREVRNLTRAFHESPVRIGRSPFASLRLRDPFVSEWQAVVRFHGERTTYLDLGGKNPTRIDGKPVERNVEVEINAQTEVCIGTVRMRFERVEHTPNALEAPHDEDTAFLANRFAEPEQPTGTVLLAEAAKRDSTRSERTAFGVSAPPLPGKAASSKLPPPLPGDDALLAAHKAYRAAAEELLSGVRRSIETAPKPARKARALALRQRFPELVHELAFRDCAAQAGVDALQLGHLDIEDWLGRLCGTPASIPSEHVAVTMERVGHLLELFATAFIESRRAHQRARRKLALEYTADARSTLQQCEDPHALLAYLLSSDPRARDRSQELRKALADFAMHQIALLSAVVEGARSMLAQLGPQALREQREPARSASVLDAQGAVGGFWPYPARRFWNRFVVRYHDLTQTDHFTRELFGREFTRRYHAIADAAVAVGAAAKSPALEGAAP